MTEQPVGRRERKKLATHNALRTAALELSLSHGVDNVTVEQIADAADVSVRTFFNYFSSKEQAVVAGESVASEAMIENLRSRPADEPILTSLREVILVMAAGIPHRDRVAQLRLVRRTPALLPHQLAAYETTESTLAQVIAERTGTDVDTELYPSLVAASVVAALRVTVTHWMNAETGGPEDLIRLIGNALDQLTNGLASGPAGGRGTAV
ncbi:MAG TPA: TetR/AcrR family transcriptional regulator [Pseudonocardia sp.]|jgi:AcrR family transcriptional regulator|nr:TetR/AcrR family transcriptional regulator [Pseudonocardia sp.]